MAYIKVSSSISDQIRMHHCDSLGQSRRTWSSRKNSSQFRLWICYFSPCSFESLVGFHRFDYRSQCQTTRLECLGSYLNFRRNIRCCQYLQFSQTRLHLHHQSTFRTVTDLSRTYGSRYLEIQCDDSVGRLCFCLWSESIILVLCSNEKNRMWTASNRRRRILCQRYLQTFFQVNSFRWRFLRTHRTRGIFLVYSNRYKHFSGEHLVWLIYKHFKSTKNIPSPCLLVYSCSEFILQLWSLSYSICLLLWWVIPINILR